MWCSTAVYLRGSLKRNAHTFTDYPGACIVQAHLQAGASRQAPGIPSCMKVLLLRKLVIEAGLSVDLSQASINCGISFPM